MMSEHDGSEKKKRSPWAPIFGLIIGGAVAIVGWFVAPRVMIWLHTQSPSFAIDSAKEIARPVFAFLLFLVGLAVTGMVVAIAAGPSQDTKTRKEYKKIEKIKRSKQIKSKS
jgi:uncharacterized membrane protein YgaE (UPF0421/DUF939 family)